VITAHSKQKVFEWLRMETKRRKVPSVIARWDRCYEPAAD